MTESPNLSRPRIDYLSRDYASLRQLLLDEFALQLPAWTERHASDLGITLIELLAYAGDYLSYYQDAVAAEAYLETARQRISLRRHARLMDYYIHNGLAARVFVQFQTTQDQVIVPAGTPLLTQTASTDVTVSSEILESYDGMVFETMHKIELYRAGNEMHVETNGASDFTLGPGATSANLSGHLKHLRLGDLICFQPLGALAAEAQSAPHTVRLCAKPEFGFSPCNLPWTTITWFDEDALPVAIPVVATMPNGQASGRLSIVLGNIALADQGRTITEPLPPVSDTGSFQPRLRIPGVTHITPYSHRAAIAMSASQTIMQDAERAYAAVTLSASQPIFTAELPPPAPHEWHVRRDLLSSSRFARDFVAEVDDDGYTLLRFGDGVYGRRPQPGTVFNAKYRVGQGHAGNLGSNSISHVVSNDTRILAVTNPLPASGGADPETSGSIRSNAPHAYRVQRRCVTLLDYEGMAREFLGVADARAERKTGEDASAISTVTIYIARADKQKPSPAFLRRVHAYLHSFALIGDVLQVRPANIAQAHPHLRLTVQPGYAYSAVANQVRFALAGVIDAIPTAFGQTIHASQWIAIASSIPGVATVSVTFRRSAQHQEGIDLAAAPISAGLITLPAPPNSILQLAHLVITNGEDAQ